MYGFYRVEKYQWYSDEHTQTAFIEASCTTEDFDEKNKGIVLEAKAITVEDVKDGKIALQTPNYITGGAIEYVDH